MSKKYKIERRDLVDFVLADSLDIANATNTIKEEIIGAGEFILGPEDLLNTAGYIPGHLLIPKVDGDYYDTDNIEVIYTQEKE